jgi:hypothetical protein
MTPLPWLNPERRPRRGRRRYCTRRTFVGFVAVLAVTAALGCGAGWDRPAPLAETPVMSTPSSLPDLPEVPPDARNLARKLHECHDLDKDLIEELELYLYSCRSPFHPSRVDDPKLLAPLFVPALAEAFERTDPALIEDRFFSHYPGSSYTEDDLVTALKRLGPTVACLARSRQAPLRRAVAWALAEMAYPFDKVRGCFTTKAAKLASLGPAGVKAADAVQPLLGDPDELVRALACQALARLRPTRETARLLVQLLDDPSLQVVIEAIEGLGWIEAEAAEAIPLLLRFLAPDRDEFDTLRHVTLKTLLEMVLSPDWVRLLHPLLKLHWEKLCPKNVMSCLDLERLAKILGGLGPAARECIPDMERLLHFSDEVIFPGQKIPIACALLEMDSGHTAARHVLEHFAESADPFNRWCVARELWDVPLALQKQFRPLLEKLAADPDEKTRNEAQDRLHDLVSVR